LSRIAAAPASVAATIASGPALAPNSTTRGAGGSPVMRRQLATVPLFSAHAERCRGLLADGDGFESHFLLALDLHAQAENPFALARTRLSYGERLRRAGRRVDAREQLRKTIEFHLSRIYRKLDIHSRAELIRRFASDPPSHRREPVARRL
jgi:Bacterial regulatory proteins, luxR family